MKKFGKLGVSVDELTFPPNTDYHSCFSDGPFSVEISDTASWLGIRRENGYGTFHFSVVRDRAQYSNQAAVVVL